MARKKSSKRKTASKRTIASTGTRKPGRSRTKGSARAQGTTLTASATASVAELEPSKPAVVGAQVAHQLHTEGRWPPNDVTKTMGPDYHYNLETLKNFLIAVREHLRLGTPSYRFAFDAAADQAFVIQMIPAKVAVLMAAVNLRTSL